MQTRDNGKQAEDKIDLELENTVEIKYSPHVKFFARRIILWLLFSDLILQLNIIKVNTSLILVI